MNPPQFAKGGAAAVHQMAGNCHALSLDEVQALKGGGLGKAGQGSKIHAAAALPQDTKIRGTRAQRTRAAYSLPFLKILSTNMSTKNPKYGTGIKIFDFTSLACP